MAKFETVYCPNLNQEISIEDYIDYMRNHTEPPTLLCPDEDCRHDCPNTRMKACACDQNENFKVSPYFATYPKHEHSENCCYTIVPQSVNEVIANRKQIREKLQAENEPIYNIVQEFSHNTSHSAYDEMVFNAQALDYHSEIKQQIRANNCTSKTEIQRCCYTTPRRTNSMAKVVDTAKELADHNDLEKAFITMNPKPRCTYERLFYPIPALNKKFVTNLYVFFGNASVYYENNTFYISCYSIKYNSKKLPVIIEVNPDTNTPTFMNAIKDCHKNWKKYREHNKNFYIWHCHSK